MRKRYQFDCQGLPRGCVCVCCVTVCVCVFLLCICTKMRKMMILYLDIFTTVI